MLKVVIHQSIGVGTGFTHAERIPEENSTDHWVFNGINCSKWTVLTARSSLMISVFLDWELWVDDGWFKQPHLGQVRLRSPTWQHVSLSAILYKLVFQHPPACILVWRSRVSVWYPFRVSHYRRYGNIWQVTQSVFLSREQELGYCNSASQWKQLTERKC